jgi:predicted amidohydrolase
MKCKLGDTPANLRQMESLAQRLRRKEVDIVCFPELVTTGYTLHEKWVDLAEPAPGPSTETLGRIAREFGFYLITGMPERDTQSNRIFNSAVLMTPQGDLAGVYRKVHLWNEERKYFTPGDRFPVFETKIGRIGVGICYDLEFPESTRIMALNGAQIVFFPAADMRPFERHIDVYVRSRAAENGVFVAFSNRIGREEGSVFFGRSQVVSPACHVLARANQSQPFAVARIEPSEILKERQKLPYLQQRVPAAYSALSSYHDDPPSR